jgi:hypothetical protein
MYSVVAGSINHDEHYCCMLLSHNHARSVIAQNASEKEKEKEAFPSN